jgi:hypothetical protein
LKNFGGVGQNIREARLTPASCCEASSLSATHSRFGLIEEALAQLKLDLAAVLSAEALFTLTDLAGVTPEVAIASLVRTAATITEAALSKSRSARSRPRS